ncbi:MAG: ATP-dependent DNA ligase [Chloroflexi bacterium]|nr:ATP-dependent DNA ligase [Chloroflexota bacterium]MBV9133370.1 ATP-dependent DNA ligase [Chloroflexota bacterium]MBV9896387.1 ATP-dependent DNA ligase [Chloroflexota bacterium]
MLLAEIVETSAAVSGTAARLEKIERLATTLKRVPPEEASIAAAYLSSQLRQRQIGVGYASIRDMPPPAPEPSLTLTQVDQALEALGSVSGAASQAERRRQLMSLFARATEKEQYFLTRLIIGELRQGALAGVMHEALAKALSVPLQDIRRAVMLRGDLHAVAEAALRDGRAGLNQFKLHVGQPIQPMLAQSATSIGAALDRISPAAIDWKLDGARVQIHVQNSDVRVFTRSLDDITSRVPELVEIAHDLKVSSLVLDGEALVLKPDGRPQPFQVSASRFGSRLDVERLRATLPLTLFTFDILHLSGEDLIDHPLEQRHTILTQTVPEQWRVPRIITSDAAEADAFANATLDRGHEGVVVKALDSFYEAGRRGTGWIKVKPTLGLDLVILAAEWGHGRRSGWLSNLHLGARDPESGSFVMLGKTFKGLTDQMLRWQTERLQQLETHRDRWTVYVRPELLAEIAFDSVQRSTRYPGGVTLRFARVVRYREDKRSEEADTIQTVQSLAP